jgi:HK97 family phage portal protein
VSLFARAWANARQEYRANPVFGWTIPTPDGFGGGGGKAMSEQAALSISTVMNCARVIHDDLGILPFRSYEGDPGGVRHALADQPQIVAEPFGPNLTVQSGMGQIAVSIKLRGRAVCYKAERDKRGFPTLLQIVHPDDVVIRRDDQGRKVFRVGGVDYPSDDFVHLRGMMLPGSVDGVDPVTYQRVTLGLASDLNEFGRNLFANAAMPSGVIEAAGEGDRKRARDIAQAWTAGHAGIVNAHKPAVLFNATWKPMSITPENAQFLATRGFLREEICGWFGVPLQRIMAIVAHASQGGGKGLDSIDQGYATHTLLPLARQIEMEWDRMIPGGARTWTQFDFSGLLRASALERAQIAQIHRTAGIRPSNEIRNDEGWAPIADPRMDDPFMPLNSNTSTAFPTDAAAGTDTPATDESDPTDGGTT